MAVLTWDGTGERRYESGTDHGVLYPQDVGGYGNGIAWNGLTAVTLSPSGAEATDLYADNIKYGSMRSAETFGFTIEAYTCPKEFYECDGTVAAADGVYIGQQKRKTFGFSYRSKIGDDTSDDKGYKLHLIYGATASPSEKAYQTINDSPEAITFSWECETTPAAVTGHQPTAHIEIDSTVADAGKLAELEKKLYGDTSTEAELPTPDEVIAIFSGE